MASVETSSPKTRITFGINRLYFRLMFCGVGNYTSEGRGGSHRRRAQVHIRFRVAHAALEIAIGGGQGNLPIAEGSLMHAQAGPASGVHHDSASVHERSDVAFAKRLAIDRARSRE